MAGQQRRLRVEPLEDRRMLAVYTVDFAGYLADSGELTSFAEALNAANFTPEPDIIEFAPSLAGSVIELGDPVYPTVSDSQIFLNYDLTIRGLGSDQLTFVPGRRAAYHSGFTLTAEVENFSISGVTFGKHTFAGFDFYFSMLFYSRANLRLEDVIATDLAGTHAIRQEWTGSITLLDTKLIGKAGSDQNFMAIEAQSHPVPVHLERTEIRDFAGGVRTAGNIVGIETTVIARQYAAYGGLLSSNGTVHVASSTISGFGYGDYNTGGIWAKRGVSVVESTISNNWAHLGAGIYTEDGSLIIDRSTIQNNIASGPGGGAYKGGRGGTVVITDSLFVGNGTTVSGSNGGGLYSFRPVTVVNSTFVDNVTGRGRPPHIGASLSAGGAIYSGAGVNPFESPESFIVGSLFENNGVTGQDSDGGALWIGMAHIESSTFRNNSASGRDGDGGAVHMGNGTIRNSTFVGNKTLGEEGDGGAIGYFGSNGSLVIENSTISGNTTSGVRSDGAGVFVYSTGNLEIRFSTITDNIVNHSSSVGGGISFRGPTSSSLNINGGVLLRNSILANNTSAGTNPDLYLRLDKLTSDYSLIEDTSGLTPSQVALITAGTGNLTGQDPMLGPLTDNGGSTLTYDLLPGSPARDAADPNIAAPLTDQRSFARVSNGRADMGALEVQVPSRVGDWDGDGDVDGRDFLQWQRGGSPEPFSQTDLVGWQEEYGSGGIADVGLGIAEWEEARPERAVEQYQRQPTRVAGTRETRSG